MTDAQGPRQGRERRSSGDRRGRDEGGALRGLVGAGPSKVGVSGALRARDVSRPTDEDLLLAEQAPMPRVGPPVTGPPKPKGPARPPDRREPSSQEGNGGSAPSSS